VNKYLMLGLLLLSGNALAFDANWNLNLWYGAGNHLCEPKVIEENPEFQNSIYRAGARANLWVNPLAAIYLSGGYFIQGCVFYEGEVLQGGYGELRVGHQKYLAAGVYQSKENPYTDEPYFYQGTLGICIIDDCRFAATVNATTGKKTEITPEPRIDYTVKLEANF